MEYRKFPGTSFEVSALGLGTSPLGGGYFHRDDDEALRVIQEAFDQGVTFFDTSDNYTVGRAETLLGRALRGHRDKVILSSKGAVVFKPLGTMFNLARPVIGPLIRPAREALFKRGRRAIAMTRNRQKQFSFKPADLARAVEGSLRRLNTDYLDIYQLHNPRIAHFRDGDVMEGLARLKQAGKIRYAGIAVLNVEDALAGLEYGSVLDSLQLPINLFEQEAIQEVLPLAKQRGIGVIARSPLAQGILTDRVGHVMADESTWHSPTELAGRKSWAAEWRRRNADDDRSLAQTALRFLLQTDGIATTIFSALRRSELQQNLSALVATPLSDDDYAALSSLETGKVKSAGVRS